MTDDPRPPYPEQQQAICNHQGRDTELQNGLAQMLADKNIRVNCVAPGPVWTPLIPSTMPPEVVKNFGDNTPIGRAA